VRTDRSPKQQANTDWQVTQCRVKDNSLREGRSLKGGEDPLPSRTPPKEREPSSEKMLEKKEPKPQIMRSGQTLFHTTGLFSPGSGRNLGRERFERLKGVQPGQKRTVQG